MSEGLVVESSSEGRLSEEQPIKPKDSNKIKLLERLNTRWTSENKINLSSTEWNRIIDGDDI